MRKIFKWTFRCILILLLLIIIAAVSIPLLFKDKLKAKLLEEIDKSLTAEAYFDRIEISSLKNFPHLTITLFNAGLTGTGNFKGDTLAEASEISISLDIKSLLSGKKSEINSILLKNPLIWARVLPSGEANYNIMKTDSSGKNNAESNFDINVDDWEIVNGRLIYDDKLQKTYIEVGGLDHSGSGDFQSELSDLDIATKVKDLTLVYNGIRYFDKKIFKADLNMEMNLKEKKFTFKDHTFQLGQFKFGFDGFIRLLENGYETDLTFIVKETDFKNLLSLLPGIYQKDMEGIKTKGEFSVDGFIKGVYDVKENKTPAYHIDLKVKDAMFRYSHLPRSVEKISFDLVADNKDGNAEHSTFNLKTFHFEVDREPVHGSIFVKGIKDLHVNADIKLKANLEQLEKIYPIDSLTLKGILSSEIKINGRYNDSLKLFPKVDAFMTLEKGFVKQTGSALEMDSIHLDAELVNSTGKLEDTRINLNNMTFLLDDEPFVMKGNVSDMKDYNYNLKIDGFLDLTKLTNVYPVSGTTVSGTMDFDIQAEGNLTKIEAKRFDLLNNSGTLEVKNMKYHSTDIAFPVHVDDALFTFDDDKIILSRFQAEFGKSNIVMSGHLYNYIPFIIKDHAPLRADLRMKADTIDLNEWFPSSISADSSSTAASTSTAEVLVIPDYIDFTFDSDISSVKFGAMDILDLDGEIRIKNSVCTLNETGFNSMDSKFVLSGDYDTRNPKHPFFDLDIDVKKLDFNKAYKMFVDPKGVAPAEGNFSTKYALKGELNPDFSPIYTTLTGGGKIIIDSVKVKGMKVMNHIKNTSKKDEFHNPELNDVTIDTQIKDGKIFLSPFTFKVNKFLAEVEGWQGFDEKMDYQIKLSVPPFNKIKIPMTISGTGEKPLIKMGKGFSHSDFEKLE
jgi:hypothetical protein